MEVRILVAATDAASQGLLSQDSPSCNASTQATWKAQDVAGASPMVSLMIDHRSMTIKKLWSIIQGRRTNYRLFGISWTYYPDGDPIGKRSKTMNTDAAKDWDRLDAIFREALEKYPHSKFALHYLWNNAIATGPESFKPPPTPPLS